MRTGGASVAVEREEDMFTTRNATRGLLSLFFWLGWIANSFLRAWFNALLPVPTAIVVGALIIMFVFGMAHLASKAVK